MVERRIGRRTAVAVAALAFASAANAQDTTVPTKAMNNGGSAVGSRGADDSELAPGEIVVTALKRKMTLQNTPASISVLNAESMVRFGVSNITDLPAKVPALVIQSSPNNSAVAVIRGIGSSTAVQSFDGSVGLFFDGIFSPRGRDFSISMFDVANVQVVKGAQTAILGKNTSAGGIVITSERPQFDLGYDALVSYDVELGSKLFQGGADIPVTSSLAFRVAGRYSEQEGWIKNDLMGEKGTKGLRLDGRISALWNPTAALNVWVYYQRNYNQARGSSNQIVADTRGIARYYAALAGVPDIETNFDSHTQQSSAFGRGFYDAYIYNRAFLQVEWDLGGGKLTSTTGWVESHPKALFGAPKGNFVDLDQLPGDYYQINVFDRSKQVSEELRFASPDNDRFSYFFGLLGYYNRWGEDYYVISSLPTFPGPPFIPPRLGATFDHYVQRTETISGFGQASLGIASGLKLLVGGRYTREGKRALSGRSSFAFARNGVVIPNPPSPAFTAGNITYAPREYSRTEGSFDPSVTLQYRPSRNLNVYMSAGQGTKSGGFQNNTSTPDANEYVKERSRTVDGGVKYDFGAGHAYLSVFHTKVHNFQLAYFTGTIFVLDRQDIRSNGFEFEGAINPLEGLNLSGNVAYAATKATGAVVTSNDGQAFRAPKWSGNMDAAYTAPLAEGWKLALSGGAEFRSSMRLSNNPVVPRSGAYTKINARVALENEKGGWELAVVGRNLTDKLVANFGYPNPIGPGVASVGSDVPRTVLLQFLMRR